MDDDDSKRHVSLDDLAGEYVERAILQSLNKVRVVACLRDGEWFFYCRIPKVAIGLTTLLTVGLMLWRLLKDTS